MTSRAIACWAACPALVLALGWAVARDARASEPLLHGGESAAHVDGPGSLIFNPAAYGVRYPSEFALTWRDDHPGTDVYRGTMVSKVLALSVWGAKNEHLGFGTGLVNGPDRLRWGLASSWIPSPRRRVADHRLGVLSRPVPWLSIGGVADHLGRPLLDGVRTAREYTLGLGLRPLALARPVAHTKGVRLTLTADARLREGQRVKDTQIRLGAEIEPVPGLALRGSFLTEERSFQLGLSLLGVNSGYHGQASYGRDHGLRQTLYSVSLHEAEDRTVFAGPKQRRVALVRVGGDLGDESLSGFSIYGAVTETPARPIHDQLARALEDPLTRGVLLDLRGASNMAQLEELRPRIARLRERGKPVVAFLEAGGGRGDFYLASACDQIVTTHEAFYAGLGLRSERRYYRGLLADWGIRIDRVSQGKYKSAYRNFSVDSTPPPDREAIEYNLDALQEMFVSTVSKDRNIPRERLLGVLDGRRWPPTELQKAGLVDTVGYREDAFRILGRLCRLGDKPRAARLTGQEARRAWTLPSRVAVVYAAGGIESGRSGNDLLLGPFVGSETLSRQIESAFRRRDVRAVVLRVESPGGTSLASDLIHHTLVRMRGETHKPLIVSMGGTAASGGYHISLPGDHIFADRFTRTGSIGVVFVKPSLEGWYAKHDVRQDAFDRGPYMRGWSLGKDWDAEIQASADSANMKEYREFVELVARSRNMTWDQAHEVAQGRVWLGTDAVERKLVDAIGGLDDAIAEARRRAHVPDGEKLALVEYRRPRPSLVERFVGTMVRDTWERSAHVPAAGEALYWMDEEMEP